MSGLKINNSRRLQYIFKISIIIIICGIIVALLPKTEGFKYSYQKGTYWKYETLTAPFDFPIHKTPEELKADVDRARSEQTPIFNFNSINAEIQTNRFKERLNSFTTETNNRFIVNIIKKFEDIYSQGIISIPDNLNEDNLTTLLIVKDNIAREVNINDVYTLKQSYETLINYIDQIGTPLNVREQILSININDYLKPDLEYDSSKTNLAIENRVKSINLTQGLVRKGEIIISKDEIINNDKYKILESYRIEHEQVIGSKKDQYIIIGSQTILVLIAILSFSLFLYYSRKRLFYNNKDFLFLYCMFLLTIVLVSLSYMKGINVLAVPVLFFIIIVNVLFGVRSAVYLLLGTTIITAYFAQNSYMYVFMQLSAGIVAIFSMRHLQRRGQLFLSISFIFLTYVLVFGAFTLIQQRSVTIIDMYSVILLLINSLLLTLTYPVLYIIEKLFGYTSEISLLEYSNPNHPVLRNLTKKAPGTFQHSLMVANLAEEAIYHIGGSPLLARTGALYHDIGKLFNPIMFIENQTGGVNPQNAYDFDESAQIIIRHVTYGLELAEKYNLPESITIFIRTHHGKSKVKYFYNSFKNKYPDKEIDESLFTYPGPDPITKECVVVMMADAVEAASRSLPVKNEENIANLVNQIIDGQLADGRFSRADITFKDITYVKKVFIDMLITAYHARIAYPKLENKPN